MASLQRPKCQSCARTDTPRLAPVHATRRTAAAVSSTAVVGLLGTGLLGAAAGAAALPPSPRDLVSSGMRKFKQQDVDGACQAFDLASERYPQVRPFLWQRGLALYYAGRFQEGAQQFRSDVAVNPNDTEEAIWAFICEARINGPERARAGFLQVGTDPRPVMRSVYQTFQQGGDVEQIRASSKRDGTGPDFYALLYSGLYLESTGSLDDPGARREIEAACRTPYAQLSDDYMVAVARVHLKQRGWA